CCLCCCFWCSRDRSGITVCAASNSCCYAVSIWLILLMLLHVLQLLLLLSCRLGWGYFCVFTLRAQLPLAKCRVIHPPPLGYGIIVVLRVTCLPPRPQRSSALPRAAAAAAAAFYAAAAARAASQAQLAGHPPSPWPHF